MEKIKLLRVSERYLQMSSEGGLSSAVLISTEAK